MSLVERLQGEDSDHLTGRIAIRDVSYLAPVLCRGFLFGNFPIPTLNPGEYGRTRKHPWQLGEHLDMDRAWSGNATAADAVAQLAWTKKYYEERFHAWQWQWSCAEHAGCEWADTLLDEIIDVTEVQP